MKLMISSDIHGSEKYCKMLVNRFKEENADRLLLLGDILYHGPRNDLPECYSPKDVIALLNELSDKILCVRGNCDAEVDSMVLNFPLSADYAYVFVDGVSIFASHGHIFNEEKLPPLKNGDILLNGHTHVPKCTKHNGYTYMNCGSASIPKEDSPHSYMTLQDGVFRWKDLVSGEEYMNAEA